MFPTATLHTVVMITVNFSVNSTPQQHVTVVLVSLGGGGLACEAVNLLLLNQFVMYQQATL